MSPTFLTRVLFLALLIGFAWLSVVAKADAQDDEFPHLIVVLYTPSDIAFPPGADERIGLTCEYAERFFMAWMKRWNYPAAREQIFDCEPNGRVRVLRMKSKFPLEAKAFNRPDPAFGSEVSDELVPKYHLGRHRHYWWVWVYYTDPPNYFSGAHGYGDHRNGGAAFINYYSKHPGQIQLDAEMGVGFNKEMSLKASIHELGHAFGLPHVGPTRRDEAPLMGATLVAYHEHTHIEEHRVCLTQASAAMLWKHPIFSGSIKDRDRKARFTVEDLEVRQVGPGKIIVRGRLDSDLAAHSVIVADDAPPHHHDYWRKTYVARLDEDGSFQVDVTEPFGQDGRLRLLFCFDNGEVSGDGEHFDIDGGLPVPYHFAAGKYRFELKQSKAAARRREPVGAGSR